MLTFNALRYANIDRLSKYKINNVLVCQNWTISQWLQALVGEIGEYANLAKKYERGDLTKVEFIEKAGKKLADVQIYLDILAYKLGVNLGQATKDKFNEVSDRIGVNIKL